MLPVSTQPALSALPERRRDRIALALIVLALFVRALVPSGWMPSQSAAGGYTVTLCTGTGAVSAWIGADGSVHKGKPVSGQAADHPCAFAGFGGALPLPLAVLPAAPMLVAAVLSHGAALPDLTVHRLAAPPPPANGPPAHG